LGKSLFLQILPIGFLAPASTQSKGHATSAYLTLGVEKEMFGEQRYCEAVNNNWLICFTLIDGIGSAGSF
jgi:hypothetical protein